MSQSVPRYLTNSVSQVRGENSTGRIRRRTLEYHQLIDEVVDADWHHPGWRLFIRAAALLEALSTRRPRVDLLRQANPGREADTFMSRDVKQAVECGDLLARAVLRARLTLDAMAKVDRRLPGQALHQTLAFGRNRVVGRPLDAGAHRNVVFLTPGGSVLAKLTAENEASVAAALAAEDYRGDDCRRWTGRRTPPAALAAAILPRPLADAMHLHREAHGSSGGPWLGVGETQSGQEIVSTSHFAVDGYGHAWLCAELFAAMDAQVERRVELRRIASRDLAEPLWSLVNPRPSIHPGFAATVLDVPEGRFAEYAYALVRALAARVEGDGFRRHSPAIQASVAPGASLDADRRRRRVLSGLLALRRTGDGFESVADFRARLGPWIERERAGEGLLSRLRFAASGAPMPWFLRRRMLEAHPRQRPWLPPATALTGYGRLSTLRFADGQVPGAPLYAASFPPRVAFSGDPTGSATLTLIHHTGGRVTASVFGVGRFGSRAAAADLLDDWQAQLAALTVDRRRAEKAMRQP